jgi:hypothetical protein
MERRGEGRRQGTQTTEPERRMVIGDGAIATETIDVTADNA